MAHAAWCENRGGELYFVEADWTHAGWVFFERSTFEVTWFHVPPRTGWLEKAERMTSHPQNAVGDNRASEAPQDNSIRGVEVGDYYDNASAFTIATSKIRKGAAEEGLAILNAIRTHIIATDDLKSRRLLLPAIEEAIEREYRKQMEARPTSDSPDRSVHKPEAPAEFSVLPGAGPKAGRTPADMVSRFKLHLIDVVAIITALTWTHSMVVHEITTLPGVEVNPIGANVVAGSILAVLLHLISRAGRG